MPVRPDKKQYGSIKEYVSILKTYPKALEIQAGNFYTFAYKINKSQQYEKIRFYDLMPLIFLIGPVKDNEDLLQGINFHQLPILARQQYISIMENISEVNFINDKRLTRLANYKRLFKFFKKGTKFAVRQYMVKNMRQVKYIPNTQMTELIKYYANTYYGSNIMTVEKKYLKFNPYR